MPPNADPGLNEQEGFMRRKGVRLMGLSCAFVVLLAAGPSLAQRRVSEEALLFRRLRDGVATVFASGGHGTGFVIDSVGLVLTNAHVVGDRYRIRVKFDDSTRVDATFLASDPKRDVAIVLVNPSVLVGRPVLTLAVPSDTMVFEGERVIAIGSPLNQEKIMTAGIVSKIEPTAVISDVNINPGNSGGPLVNMNGTVIAINTFGDFSDRGPGVSGSVLITEGISAVTAARAAMDSVEVPSARRLPVAPRGIFPLDSLQVAAGAKKFDAKPYYVHDRTSTGKFEVVVSTPIFAAWRMYSFDVALAKQTKKREAKGRVSEDQSYDPLGEMREWMRYTRGGFPPVVTLEFTPKMGETGGSLFGNILGAAAAGASGSYYRGSHKMEFKADFKDVRIFRDSVEVEDVARFRAMQPLVFSKSTWSADYHGADQARVGIFQCTADWFAPDGDAWPTIRVEVTSVERPDKPYVFNLPQSTVKRVWTDFEAYRVANQ